MKLEIGKLKKKDYKKAIAYAEKGMHFDWYIKNGLLRRLYGRYFWYLEMSRATQVIAAYRGKEFAGVLLAEIKGEKQSYRSAWKSFYIKAFEFLQGIFMKEGVDLYNETNREMLAQYCRRNTPDGEIVFLAANPKIKAKGIGSALLREFEHRAKGKKIYLYTDSACTYQFYEHRGFERSGEKDIVMELGKNKVELRCFLYSKVIK